MSVPTRNDRQTGPIRRGSMQIYKSFGIQTMFLKERYSIIKKWGLGHLFLSTLAAGNQGNRKH